MTVNILLTYMLSFFPSSLNILMGYTLARTSYFAILDRTCGGGCHPRLVCPLIEIELRNNNKRKDRDVVNLNIPDFTTLGQILTFPGQVKQKMLLFWEDRVLGE